MEVSKEQSENCMLSCQDEWLIWIRWILLKRMTWAKSKKIHTHTHTKTPLTKQQKTKQKLTCTCMFMCWRHENMMAKKTGIPCNPFQTHNDNQILLVSHSQKCLSPPAEDSHVACAHMYVCMCVCVCVCECMCVCMRVCVCACVREYHLFIQDVHPGNRQSQSYVEWGQHSWGTWILPCLEPTRYMDYVSK